MKNSFSSMLNYICQRMERQYKVYLRFVFLKRESLAFCCQAGNFFVFTKNEGVFLFYIFLCMC